MHSVELPLQTPLDSDQMQPLPPPEDTDKKKNSGKKNFSLFQLEHVHLRNICSK